LVEQPLDAARIPGAFGVILGEGVALSLALLDLLLEVVDLAAGACLATIEATGVQEEGTAHLLAVPSNIADGHCRGGDQGMHAPIHAEHPLDVSPSWQQVHRWDGERQIEDGGARAAGRYHLAQHRGEQRGSCSQPREQALRQRDDRLAGAPGPVPLRIGAAEAEPNDAPIQVECKAVGLPLLAAIIAGIAEQPGAQQRKGLQLLVGGGEAIVLEKVVTALLDHVLQRQEAGIVRSEISSEGSDSRGNDLALLAGRSALGLGTNESRTQEGQNLGEELLALGLGAQETTDD